MKLLLVIAGLGLASASCPNDCSGHGSCNVYSSCECYRNWMGADCSERMCYFGLAFVDTPSGDLNTDGFISDNQYRTRMTNQDNWEIYPWYAGWGSTAYDVTGASGSTALAVTAGGAGGEAHFYKECSNKGICNRGSGLCECFPGFTGEGCTRTACPNDCSGHGTCERMVDKSPAYRGWDMWATQECACDPGYFGPDCSMRKCPMGDDPVTKYDGYTRITLKDKANYANGYYDTALCNASNCAGDPCVGSDFPTTTATRPGYRLWTHEPFGCVATDDSTSGAGTGTTCIGWNPWYSKAGAGADNASVTHDDTAGTADLCFYGTNNSGPEVCMQKPVRYASQAQYQKSAMYTHSMIVTGSDSQATGTLTGGSCVGAGIDVQETDSDGDGSADTYECSQLDFWSLYLKDVTGQFQIGDSLNVKAAVVGTVDISSTTYGDAVTAAHGSAFNYDLCNYIKEVGTYYASNTGTGGVQQDEEQVITIKFAAITGDNSGGEHHFGGHFAIEFTDELGDTWMTKSIPITSTTNDLQTGSILESASVHYDIYPIDTSFTGGNTPADLYTSTPNGDPTSHLSRAIEEALEELPNGVVGDVHVEYLNDSTTTTTSRSYAISFVENSGNIPALTVAYSLTEEEGGAKRGFTNATCRGSSANCINPYSGSAFTGLASDQTTASVTVKDTSLYGWPRQAPVRGQDGSKENIECSNRGICDYSTGLCKCFTGYTDEDCSRQNALSMA